eukprot:3543465-Ditylum_brightwellii.AAC.1
METQYSLSIKMNSWTSWSMEYQRADVGSVREGKAKGEKPSKPKTAGKHKAEVLTTSMSSAGTNNAQNQKRVGAEKIRCPIRI